MLNDESKVCVDFRIDGLGEGEEEEEDKGGALGFGLIEEEGSVR